MTRKQRRFILIGTALSVLGLSLALVLGALRDSIVFFQSPTEIAEGKVPVDKRLRLGGLVKDGTVKRGDNLLVEFAVTDGNKDVAVSYRGVVPDLFREGQGVVVEGKLTPTGLFVADNVLAKHDENYMPREVADALKKTGRWKEGEGKMVPTK